MNSRTNRTTGWIPVSRRKPAKGQRPDALGVEVLIWPRHSDGATAYYGRRVTTEPNFYKYGTVLHYVTHWKPLPKGPK